MPRTIRDARIHERSSRLKLKVQNTPYWRFITEGFHLGYYRGPKKASWVARLRVPDSNVRYRTEAIGEPDDILEADGERILNWKQALDRGLEWKNLLETKGEASDPGVTVATAVEDYIERRDTRRSSQAGRTLRSDAYYRLSAYVLANKRLASTALKDLSESDLIAWQRGLKGLSPATRQRTASDFKAALNAAYVMNRKVLPGDVPTAIRFGLQMEAREVTIARARDNQILGDNEIRAIIAAAQARDEDFGRLVLVLAATGARFAQVQRMRVGDVQAGQGRLMVPQSFKGGRQQIEHIRVAIGADTLAALAPVLQNRPLSAPLLERYRMRQVSGSKWEPYERGAWKNASEMTRMWREAVAKAGLPRATIPYALRHSSIVRGLRAGLPIRLVAALHDTSVAMIERHYSRWITEGLEELVARAIVPLVE